MSFKSIASDPYSWPYDGAFSAADTALIIIDMQTDFCGIGGYVDKMGYDLALTRAPIEPIRALLSRALLAFALEYERAPGPPLAVSANVLRVIGPDGVRTRDIPALAGISKESVAMAAGLLAEGGLATEGPDPDGSRFKVTRLTAAGTVARDAYPARAADIEADWRARFGEGRVEAVRAALEPLIAGDPPAIVIFTSTG